MDNFNNANNFQSPAPIPSQEQEAPAPDSNGLSTVSLVLGICSLVFICCGGGIVLGSLGLLFALLSRGATKMSTQAKVGLGLSIGGFVLSLIILFIYIPSIILSAEFQDSFYREFNRQYNYYYDDEYYDYDYWGDEYWDDEYWDDEYWDDEYWDDEYWEDSDFSFPPVNNKGDA